jgi:CRP-like cAMP-binding protein
LLLEEEKGFCIVVDGLVQVFVKAARTAAMEADAGPAGYGGAFHDEEEETLEDGQGYQLLTEVKNGAPMSSLFTILSLFTEDVKLRHEDEDEGNMSTSSSMVNLQSAGDLNPYDTADISTGRYQQTRMAPVPPFSLNGGGDSRNTSRPVTPGEGQSHNHPPPQPQRPQRPRMKKSKSVHPDIVARATVDTTIAVIPASAFRRLTRIYPKATAHIVQVILTRFQRVTFLTGYNYLGLTSEVLRTEKFMNRYTMYELPNHLRGGALDRLKEKFKSEQERAELEDSMKGIVLHNPGAAAARRRRSSSSLRKEAAVHARLAAARGIPSPALDTASSPLRNKPVDLPSSPALRPKFYGSLSIANQISPFSQGWTVSQPSGLDAETLGAGERPFNPFSKRAAKFMPDGTENEDMVFREAVLECMFKAIGLTGSTINTITGTESGDQSPRLVSYDSMRQKAVFTNAFGHFDAYDGSHDGETDSIASTSVSGASTSGFVSGGISGIHADLKDDVEIVFFPKGAVLVEQGERNPGLYYVIDGFLDVSIPVDEKDSGSVLGGGNSGTPMNIGSLGADLGLPPLKRQSSFASSSSQRPSGMGRGKKLGRKSLFMIKPGGVAGYIGSISSYRSFIDVRAKTDVYVGFLPRAALERIVERHPVVLLTMAKRLTSLLPRLILHIDFALEWLQVNAGQVIYHQGDERYVSFSGRYFSRFIC